MSSSLASLAAQPLASQQQTWLKLARHVVYYSEVDIAALPAVGLRPPPAEELVGGGAWKNFPALLDLHRRFPAVKWVFFHDDDTYVFPFNLLRFLALFNPDRDFYLGLYWTPRVDMEWKDSAWTANINMPIDGNSISGANVSVKREVNF